MEEKKEKRMLRVELNDNVKKVSITGLGNDDQVVMKQELSEEDLDRLQEVRLQLHLLVEYFITA